VWDSCRGWRDLTVKYWELVEEAGVPKLPIFLMPVLVCYMPIYFFPDTVEFLMSVELVRWTIPVFIAVFGPFYVISYWKSERE